MGKTKTPKKTGTKQKRRSDNDSTLYEFHRDIMALLPSGGSGVAYLHGTDRRYRYCTCSPRNRERSCRHLSKLEHLFEKALAERGGITPGADFEQSVWYPIARALGEDSPEKTQSARVRKATQGENSFIHVSDGDGSELLYYYSKGPDLSRFLDRLGVRPNEGEMLGRKAILEQLARMAANENEKSLNARGGKSRRQVLEETFWYRLAYHAYREFGNTGLSIRSSIGKSSGAFTLLCALSDGRPVFRIIVPRQRVKRLIADLGKVMPELPFPEIHPLPLKTVVKVADLEGSGLEIRPMLRFVEENGAHSNHDMEAMERFQYGDLFYFEDRNVLAVLEKGAGVLKLGKPGIIQKSEIPAFLDGFGGGLKDGLLVDAEMKELRIFQQAETVGLFPEAVERDWCWLSVRYGFGSESVSLADILNARKEGRRYIECDDGWVDCRSPGLKSVDFLDRNPVDGEISKKDVVKMSFLDILRIRAFSGDFVHVEGNGDGADRLRRFLELKPARPVPSITGMSGSLRNYQKIGVEWLGFLFENGFGGVLCDDMGLGKTHQVMALMLVLRERDKLEKPMLVVAPTTVISHWKRKIRDHAPGLKASVYHGGDRDLNGALETGDILVTSYGILRRDIDKLSKVPFALAVFDEIQYVKNQETLAYKAGRMIDADMKLGLTGTPIENRLSELKAIMDLTLPGYLGKETDFQNRYVQPVEERNDSSKRDELSRLISPFTLRRLKKTVLDELPEKIEDIRTCELSDIQVKLYRDALASRGKGLADIIAKGEKPIPYMHIFALLNLLKQICDHPALVKGEPDDYEKYESGKWELFEELLSECLDSGQKIVVYSQYLGMIKIIGNHLEKLDTEFVTLTGKSRDRGKLIERFEKDDNCRVFVGSLKAGGTGIDLVSASVVVHYDRWWNAAKEDQATDRVHRIGQKRGVHVFKLVTEGTLEEKISVIIDKKRNLMDSIVKEDDPGLLKAFSKEDLIDFLRTGG